MTSKNLSVTTKSAANRVIRFIGSDESIDRDGDTISIDGWEIGNYMKNPVVLFGHDYNNLPVGKTISVTADKRSRQLMFDIYFPTIEEITTNAATPSEHALRIDAIYNMAKSGILNTVSVGFRGLDYESTATGRAYKKQELMEISIVPVPANPNAVAVMRAAGVADTIIKGVTLMAETIEKGGKRLSAESRKALEGCHGAIKTAVEELYKFITADDVEEKPAEEDGKTGNPAVGEEIGSDVNKPQPEKMYIVEIVEKASTSKE